MTKGEILALAAAGALFVLLAALAAARQTYPYFDDVAYLSLGHEVKAIGGPLQLLRALFAGVFEEANRHPLYLAVLSLVARWDPSYHRDAQAVTIALGVMALVSCWWLARRWLGPVPAAMTAFLLAGSRAFVECSSRAWCEPLLVAVWAQAIAGVLDGLDPGRPPRLRPWLLAGAWSGLAYLAKGTGLFLPVSVALAFLVAERLRAALDRRAWVYAAGFLAAASPLLVRNWRVYGTPLYNTNLAYFWMDRLPDFAEVLAPQASASLPHGFLDYVQHLTPGALLHRIGVGIGETTFIMAESMAPVGGVLGGAFHVAGVLLGAFAAAVALRYVWRRTSGLGRTFLLVHAGFTYLFLFVFSVNGGSTRYFMPLAATVLMPALAARIAEDVRAAGSPLRSRWAVRAAIVAAAVAIALPPPALVSPGMDGARDWLVRNLRPGDVYAIDARTHLQPRWLARGARQVTVSASWKERPVDAALLLAHLEREGVRVVLLDAGSSAFMASGANPEGRRYFFYDRLPLEADGSLPLRGFPGGLTPAYVDPGSPRRWIVLETPWSRRQTRAPPLDPDPVRPRLGSPAGAVEEGVARMARRGTGSATRALTPSSPRAPSPE